MKNILDIKLIICIVLVSALSAVALVGCSSSAPVKKPVQSKAFVYDSSYSEDAQCKILLDEAVYVRFLDESTIVWPRTDIQIPAGKHKLIIDYTGIGWRGSSNYKSPYYISGSSNLGDVGVAAGMNLLNASINAIQAAQMKKINDQIEKTVNIGAEIIYDFKPGAIYSIVAVPNEMGPYSITITER